MNLDELAAVILPAAPRPAVPGWTVGCFRRRSITYFTGQTDTRTEVWWLQSRGLTADLRVYPGRPALAGRSLSIDACTADELRALAATVEGGLARTWCAASEMTWTDWTSFQTHTRWPEAGHLARIGDCMIEQAPSGAYVEDWRLQPSPPGPLIGLVLVEERQLNTGQVRHRGGGLVVCGQHAALVRGRPAPLPGPPGGQAEAGLRELLGQHAANPTDPGHRTRLNAVFGCEVSYAAQVQPGGPYVVQRSTHPWIEGHPLPLDGFEFRPGQDLVIQRLSLDGEALERSFTIDTLETGVSFDRATPVDPGTAAWLERESDVLLADVERP